MWLGYVLVPCSVLASFSVELFSWRRFRFSFISLKFVVHLFSIFSYLNILRPTSALCCSLWHCQYQAWYTLSCHKMAMYTCNCSTEILGSRYLVYSGTALVLSLSECGLVRDRSNIHDYMSIHFSSNIVFYDSYRFNRYKRFYKLWGKAGKIPSMFSSL